MEKKIICDKSECTGCFACYNICPKKAIYMKEDEYGNIYPLIDSTKCVNCELCKTVCPQLKEKMEFKMPKTAYAMYSKDNNIRKESTSGGIATMLYNKILSEHGVAYGASNLLGRETFEFIRIISEEELYKVKGSKYVHCYISDNYKKIKNDLENNKRVIFIGTPCQVAGLKSFLNKDYDQLLTVDIICHGVPSQKLLLEDLNCNGIEKERANYVLFRCEEGFKLKVFNSYEELKKEEFILSKFCNTDYYYKNFLEGNIYRENCYKCKYARKERISDITIGDFWGLDKKSKIYDNELKGISVVLPITEKGYRIIKEIQSKCSIEERTIDEAMNKNGQLSHPMLKNETHNKFLKYYPKYGYKKTMKKITPIKDKIKYCNIVYGTYIKMKKKLL